MKRLNFTLDDATVTLLQELSERYYNGNKSYTVRAALESLASHSGHDGWIIAGYSPMALVSDVNCHACGSSHAEGEIMYRPVFERGKSPDALPSIPGEPWLDCPKCVESVTKNY
ncbi:MAG: hypothetical protein AAFW89_04915 [Bacteroidota bacterium]